MVSRERILEAAARVYARHGFRGATTRLIAIEAEVNEVTLFRTFGSKGALLEAVLLQHVGTQGSPTLPADPADPPTELEAFIAASLQQIDAMRPLLIQTMGEIESRPDAYEFACRGRRQVHDIITTYVRRLQAQGMADASVDVDVAALMLTAAIMGDVMSRPIVPDVYPPREGIAARYAALFLRAVGYGAKLGVPEQNPNRPAPTGAEPAAPAAAPTPSHPAPARRP